MTEMSETTEASLGYDGLYLERFGLSAAKLAENLVAPPERQLPEDKKLAVFEFEHELFDFRVELEGQETETVGDILGAFNPEDIEAPLFFTAAFKSGEVDLSHIQEAAPRITIPEFDNDKTVYNWLADLIAHQHEYGLRPDGFRKIAKQSSDYFIDNLAKRITSNDTENGDLLEFKPLVVDPRSTLIDVEKLGQIRKMLLAERKKYKSNDADDELAAKRAVVDVYLAVVNSRVASGYSRLGYLYDQVSGLESGEVIRSEIERLAPSPIRAALRDIERRKALVTRLDFIRNGIAIKGTEQGSKNRATPISPALIALSTVGITSQKKSDEQRAERAEFTPAEVEKLKNYTMSPDDMQAVMTGAIQELGLLSEQEDYDINRAGRTTDGKWQVIQNPGKNTFAVEAPKGFYKSASQPRSLYDLLLVGGAHELRHIQQGEADEEIARVLKIAGVQGKRVSGLREAGAGVHEIAAQISLFGETPQTTPALTYANALETLRQDGTLSDAAFAFYRTKLEVSPGFEPTKAAKLASDRVLRLIREGGTNSQPLSYDEEYLMNASLAKASPAARERATKVVCLDLTDQVRLHQFGLLPEVTEEVPRDWLGAVMRSAKPFIDLALAA